MTEHAAERHLRRLTTPHSAAVAGVLFGLIFGTVLVLIRLALPEGAVHGGVLPLMFDSVFGMVIHATGRPISRTGFLHVDYRKVTPIDTPLTVRGWVRAAEGRNAQGGCDGNAADRPAVYARCHWFLPATISRVVL